MKDEPIHLHRQEVIIEGDRKLHMYTFTDAEGRLLAPEHGLVVGETSEGNLGSTEGEDRKE